jgi:hypothetical protein
MMTKSEIKKLEKMLTEANGNRHKRTLMIDEVLEVCEYVDKITLKKCPKKYRDGICIFFDYFLPKNYKYRAFYTDLTLIYRKNKIYVCRCSESEVTKISHGGGSKITVGLTEKAHQKIYSTTIEIKI